MILTINLFHDMKSNDESYARRVHVYQSRIGLCSRREAIASLVTGIRSMVEEMPREQLELLAVGVEVKRNRRDDHGQEH